MALHFRPFWCLVFLLTTGLQREVTAVVLTSGFDGGCGPSPPPWSTVPVRPPNVDPMFFVIPEGEWNAPTSDNCSCSSSYWTSPGSQPNLGINVERIQTWRQNTDNYNLAAIKLVYSDGTSWTAGDLTNSDSIVQLNDINLVNSLITGAGMSFLQSPNPYGHPTGSPTHFHFSTYDVVSHSSAYQQAGAFTPEESQYRNTYSQTGVDGLVLWGAAVSMCTPAGSNPIITSLSFLLLDITLITRQVTSWPDLSQQLPSQPRTWSETTVNGCDAVNGSQPTTSLSISWTKTLSQEVTNSVSTSSTVSLSASIEANEIFVKETTSASFGFTVGAENIIAEKNTTSEQLMETETVPAQPGYIRTVTFFSFTGSMRATVEMNYVATLKNGATFNWTLEEVYSGIIGNQLFTTVNDTSCGSL